MWKNEQEQLIFDYVFAEQILKRDAAGEATEEFQDKLVSLGNQLNVHNPAIVRKCIAVSKGIVNRRNSMYKTLVEKAISPEDAAFIEHYVYMCIQNDIEPEPDRILQVKLLI